MKKSLLILAIGLLAISAQCQIDDSLPPWFKLDRIPGVGSAFKSSTKSLYTTYMGRNYNSIYRDSLFWVKDVIDWEKKLASQSGGLVSRRTIQAAKRKYPTNNFKDVTARQAIYHKELDANIRRRSK